MLLLFDIDGTLLSGATGAHSRALDGAIREVHGVSTDDLRSKIGPAGRTDGEIARLILLDLGVSARRIDERADDVREACCRIYAEICPPDLSDHVVPGIADLLPWLADRDGVTLGLLTGNFEPVARLKLGRAGIGRWFGPGLGAFGSDSEDRAALPAIARRRAGHVPREQTVVIGDTPRDIACARADDVRCVAVATGQFGLAELADADAVARDAGELRLRLEELGA
ncbi:MAG TPA: haloacid dehalogenase-like hydrolase [Solirubrobacteraceae bacterium]|nr:haloacid dehalogenase-like hydrolase [Solirubrobacteraceae bacterium]